jgi:hypothetical protein
MSFKIKGKLTASLRMRAVPGTQPWVAVDAKRRGALKRAPSGRATEPKRSPSKKGIAIIMSAKSKDLIPEKRILKIIMLIRGEKVILDSDLANLYGVETRRLNEQVRRNIEKFPDDFMFQLTKEEFENLKSQIATSSSGWGGRRKLPFVFTEHGALQAANVLNSLQANKMSVFIVRIFVRLREMVLTNEKLSRKVDQLENRVSDHDEILIELVREIRKLIDAPKPTGNRRSIGFIESDKLKKK